MERKTAAIVAIAAIALAGWAMPADAIASPGEDVRAFCERRYLTEEAADRRPPVPALSVIAPPAPGSTPTPPPPAPTFMQSRGGQPAPVMPLPDREQYPEVDPNPVNSAFEDPVSTFSLDVDTASYSNVRRFLRDGGLPPRDAVRTEELVNYFDYDYPLAEDRTAPFRPTVAVHPTPWNAATRILHIGLRGFDLEREERPPANLVFLMDVSGSMSSRDKLPLAKAAICLLVHELDARDRVALVVYAGAAGAVLEPTSGTERETILTALDRLEAGGSTAGGEGIALAYELARANFDEEASNRIILTSDGDFNVGIADPRRLGDFVARERESGVYLTVLGFGGGNYNDTMMQRLAQLGNGAAAYIDDLDEAHRVLVEKMTGSLFTIAKDVKVQVEFNPDQVKEYRLIGYETRLLRREDFTNDAVDAGEVGAGHSVTALYEYVPAGSDGGLLEPLRYAPQAGTPEGRSAEIAYLRIRYKLPGESESRSIERAITAADAVGELANASADMRFAAAVAGFSQLLRGEPYVRDGFGYDSVVELASTAAGEDPFREGFIELAKQAAAAGNLDMKRHRKRQ